jgi:hypothetical protein
MKAANKVARFEVLTAVLLSIAVIWNVTLCYWVHGCQCFKGAIFLQNIRNNTPNNRASHPIKT